MAYIDKIKSGNKNFYYLGKTIRINQNKWKKIRIKLGTEKPTKEVIAKKLKELKLEQYKIYNEEYIDSDKLEVIDDFKEVYQNHLKKLPKTVVEKEEEDFVIRFTYNSNAIEGNRLTLRDTYLIIKEKQIPSGAPPKDYNEAINGREALDYLKKYKDKLTIEFIEKLNEILTKNTGVLYPGRIRFFPVKIEGADFTPPDEKEVPRLIADMIDFYYKNKNKFHPFVMACLIHAKFVEIHPFEDGNGRTGRALMNWVLMKAGYPKLYVPVRNRQKYYEAIDLHNIKKYKEYCTRIFEIMIEQINIVHKK
jgi:Fic family protein